LRRCSSCLWGYRIRTREKVLADHNEFGREGERQAARFLRSQGYKILYRNFRPPVGGEVDLICRHRNPRTLVFIEVKSRRSERYGTASAAVGRKKQKRLILAAQYWLSLLERPDVTVQFDVLEVICADGTWKIRHIADAFSSEEPSESSVKGDSLIPAANRGGVRPKRGHASGARFPRHRDRG